MRRALHRFQRQGAWHYRQFEATNRETRIKTHNLMGKLEGRAQVPAQWC
jgi:hypothetical protein